jgi:hypothetical protein
MAVVYSELRRRVRRPATFEACLPRKAKEPPSGPGWIHEIKHDGFRILARKDGDLLRYRQHDHAATLCAEMGAVAKACPVVTADSRLRLLRQTPRYGKAAVHSNSVREAFMRRLDASVRLGVMAPQQSALRHTSVH